MRLRSSSGARSLGLAAPNPSVGAILVKDGVVVGRGVTAPGGRPHAEPIALAEAGDGGARRDALCHARALLACRRVAALRRRDHRGWRRAGRGGDRGPQPAGRRAGALARLAAAGVAVTVGPGADQARRDHLGHIRRVTEGRPSVTLKLAETGDGYAAGGPHDQRLKITGPIANARVQIMRATHEAIMVGVETALADDPVLTVRLPGLDRKLWRVVLDTHLSLPPRSRLAALARRLPTLVIAAEGAPDEAEARLADCGVHVARVSLDAGGHVDLGAALGVLSARGITRVFSEGGPRVGCAADRPWPGRPGRDLHRQEAARPSRPAVALRSGARGARRSPALPADRTGRLRAGRDAGVGKAG